MNPHPLEWVFLGAAVISLFSTGYMFTLKLSDLAKVKRGNINGAILFMKRDNIREQAFFLALSAYMVGMAVSSLNNNVDVTSQARNLLVGMIFFALGFTGNSAFAYRRRGKMAVLVAKEEARDMPGGRRASDPPKRGEC